MTLNSRPSKTRFKCEKIEKMFNLGEKLENDI